MAWFDFLKAKPAQAPVQQFNEKDFDAAVYDTAMKIVKESIDYSALPFISPSEPYWDDPSFTNGAPMGFSGPYGMPRRTGRGDFPPAYWDEQSLMRLINWSRWMYVNNGYARAIARTRVNYVVKNGFAFTFKPVKGASEADAETMQEWFAQWSAMVNFPLRSREMWYRRDRDGDCFVRMFRRGNGFPSLRFIEPEYVRDGKGENETTFGILTKHNDIEAVTGYRVQRDPYNMESLKDISADLIEHFKCEADSGCKRGVPILYAIQDDLYKLQKTDTNLSTLIAVVSAIAMVRKRSQNRTAIDTRNQANADYTKTDVSTGNTDYYKRYKPGSIVDIGINDEFDIPASKVNLGGVIQARQTELESCSAGVNMPYYMLSGDASNGNLSTTQVSESPAICNFESEQAECAYHLGMGRYFEGAPHGLVWKAARIAVDEGLLPPSVLDNVEIVCKGQSAVVRDRAAETNRHSIMLKDGVMTKKQYADAEPDVDYDEEGLAKEKEERQADEQAGRDHEIAMAQASGQSAKADTTDKAKGEPTNA